MLDELMKYRHCAVSMNVNYRFIPVSNLGMTDESAHFFNRVLDWVNTLGIPMLKRTKSGGVSKSSRNYVCAGWDVSVSKICVELVVIWHYMWRFQFRHLADGDEEVRLYGSQAFGMFRDKCKEFGIELDDYAIDNGEEVKKEIEPYMIWVDARCVDLTLYGVNHIDFHNSFPGGLVNTHPEFAPVVNWFYDGRKEHREYKDVLNLTIGYCQSVRCCGAKWAHLAKDAIGDNNRRIRELADRLKAAGRYVIAYNTDGIWYKGDVYHGEGEGARLGEWENDHIDCRIRFKSKGAYEFEEDGVYYPVIRGRTKLDRVKARGEWQWGDIYREDAAVVEYYYKPGVGITNYEGDKL